MTFRTEIIGDQTLILGDCREVMPTLGRFDACVTDPPYGIGRDGHKPSTSKHGGHKGYEFTGWDDKPPTQEIFELIHEKAENVIIWGANYYPQHLRPSMGWLVWDKGQRICQSDCELAYTTLRQALRSITINRVSIMGDGAVHPTQKPLEVMRWCLGFVPDAETILDPFMGSGTTLVACQQLGRKGTGIEISEKYFDIACKRVEQAAAQPRLFTEPVQKPKQEVML